MSEDINDRVGPPAEPLRVITLQQFIDELNELLPDPDELLLDGEERER